MNRRKFCGLAALAAVGMPGVLKAMMRGATPGQPCRVTVMRRECYHDLQASFLDEPETGPCTCFTVGQTFTSHAGECPEGFCPKAWEAINGSGACLSGSCLVSCPDGSRPVIFRIER